MPVLFVWGGQDGVFPPKVGKRAARTMSDAHVEVIDGAGHFVWLDPPDRTARSLLDFLG